MNIEQKVGLHNEFLIEVVDKKTGKVKQTAKAYNMILDQFYTKICNFAAYFVNIHFGTGTGTQATSRTSLFTHLGTKAAADVELKKDVANNNIYWKRMIQIMPEEYVGSSITEVGIAYGSTSSNLVTHALIKDSMGNPITIAKTDSDVINIYATVYVVLNNNYSNMAWVTTNELINYLIGNTTFPTMYFYLAKRGEYIPTPGYPILSYSKLGSSGSIAQADWIKDAANKKVTTPVKRIDVNTANGFVKEIGFGSSETSGIFRTCLPVTGVYTSESITNEPLGVGDGVIVKWPIAFSDAQNVTLKVDDTVVTGSIESINLPPNTLMKTIANVGSGWGYGCAISSDGTYAAAGFQNAPFLYIYKRNSVGGFSKLPNPSYLPTNYPNSMAFSHNGQYLAVGSSSSSPYLYIYKNINDTFERITTITGIPAGVYSLAFSPDDTYLVLGSGSSASYVTIMKRDGDTFTKLTEPASSPGTTVYSIDWSPDGTYLFLGLGQSPWMAWYKRNGDAFTKLPNPTTLPTGYGGGVSCRNGFVAYAHENSPYITLYKLDSVNDTLTKLDNPASLPATSCYACGFTPNANYLMVGINNSSFINTYRRKDDTFTKTTGIDATYAGSFVRDLMVSDDGQYMILMPDTCYPTIYKSVGQQVWATFDTPPASGTIPKASYSVDYIPKDTNRVIDLQFSIQFGEVA